MKFIATFKDPDYMVSGDYGPEVAAQKKILKNLLGKFLEYDEYIRIEIDTETKTARVLEN